ncbi:MAG: rane protein [Frankiales bacterium]|nr:rane protein [Frankiales bacterium]
MALGRGKAKGKGKPAKKAGPSRKEKFAQIKLAFSMTRKADPKMLPLVLGAFVITLAVFVLLGTLVGHVVYLSVIGVLLALLVAAAIFGRRVQKTAFGQVEGQLGAAAAVLSNMRGNWRVTPAVGFTKEQDLLHRVIGLPGIVLVGEGSPSRLRGLIGAEKRALSRVIGDTPIYDVMVGDDEGQISLRELEKHFMKLPRNIKPARVNELEPRLKALRANGALPVPKGPMPTRVPRGR